MSLRTANAAAVVRLCRYGVTRRKLLQRVLEESVFECPLKRAGFGVADPKSRTDFELHGAISFDIVPAALLERRAHRGQSERRRVAIAAEMPEHNSLDFCG